MKRLMILAVMLTVGGANQLQACNCSVKTKTVVKTTTVRSTQPVTVFRTYRLAPLPVKAICPCDLCSCPVCDCGINCSCVTKLAPVLAPIQIFCAEPAYRVAVKDVHRVSSCSVKQTVRVYNKEACQYVDVDICVPPTVLDASCHAKRVGNTTNFKFPGHDVQVRFKGSTVVVDYDV